MYVFLKMSHLLTSLSIDTYMLSTNFPVFLFVTDLDVSLDVFLNFNKIKELANGIEDIQKALDGSESLKLSSDRQSVRRVTEMRKKDDIDEYMIYVVCRIILF